MTTNTEAPMATNEELRAHAEAGLKEIARDAQSQPKERQPFADSGEQIAELSRLLIIHANLAKEWRALFCNEVPRLLDEIADYAETKRRMTDDYFAMDAGLRDLEKQLATKDRRIEALRKGIELHGIIGSCDCDTKHPDIAIHKPYCTYRNFSLLLEADARASKETP